MAWRHRDRLSTDRHLRGPAATPTTQTLRSSTPSYFSSSLLGRRRRPCSKSASTGAFLKLPWSAMARTRDRIAHHYFRLDREIVWETVTKDIPALASAAADALASLAPPSPPRQE